MPFNKYADDMEECPRLPTALPKFDIGDAMKPVVPELTIFNAASSREISAENPRTPPSSVHPTKMEHLMKPVVPDLSVINLEPVKAVKSIDNPVSYGTYKSYTNRLQETQKLTTQIATTITKPPLCRNPSIERYCPDQRPLSTQPQSQPEHRKQPFFTIAQPSLPPTDVAVKSPTIKFIAQNDSYIQQLAARVELLEKEKIDMMTFIQLLSQRLEKVEKHAAECCSKPVIAKSTIETGVQCILPTIPEHCVEKNQKDSTESFLETDCSDYQYQQSSPKWVNKPLHVEIDHNITPKVTKLDEAQKSEDLPLSEYENRRPLLEDTALSVSNVNYLERYCLVSKSGKVIEKTPNKVSPVGRRLTPLRTPEKSPWKRLGIADRVLDIEFIKNQAPFPNLR